MLIVAAPLLLYHDTENVALFVARLVPRWREPSHRWMAEYKKKPFWTRAGRLYLITFVFFAIMFLFERISPGWAD